jgi:hypothetical protein
MHHQTKQEPLKCVKQANDYQLERDAAIARVRAERKCGELLRDMNLKERRESNLNTSPKLSGTTSTKTLSEMGVTKDQSSKWQKLADVPEEVFEGVIDDPGMPETDSRHTKTYNPEQSHLTVKYLIRKPFDSSLNPLIYKAF